MQRAKCLKCCYALKVSVINLQFNFVSYACFDTVMNASGRPDKLISYKTACIKNDVKKETDKKV